MNTGPLNPVPAAAAITSVICLACSCGLTPSAPVLVGAPISVLQIFLPASPCATMMSRIRPTSDQPFLESAARPPGNTYGCAFAASKNGPAPASYICCRNPGGESLPPCLLNPPATTVAPGWAALIAG